MGAWGVDVEFLVPVNAAVHGGLDTLHFLRENEKSDGVARSVAVTERVKRSLEIQTVEAAWAAWQYAMFDEVARERGAWDDLCVESQVRALAGRGFCKPCNKFYDDNKGLEAHQKRRHPRPPEPSDERDADGEREA